MAETTPNTTRKKKRKIPGQSKTRNKSKVRWPYPCSSSSSQTSFRFLPYLCLAQTPSSTYTSTHEAPLSYTFPSFSPKLMCCWLILLPFQVQKKTTKAKRPHERNSRKESPQSSVSCPRILHIPIKPTTYICYHKPNKTPNENKKIRHKEHWKIQPFQLTCCESSKCRAWTRGLALATASSEAAMEKWLHI